MEKLYPENIDMKALTDDKYNSIGKMILINSYCFRFFYRNHEIFDSLQWSEIVENLMRKFPSAKEITSARKKIYLKSSSETSLDVQKSLTLRNIDIFRKKYGHTS
jgi:hypothetical protein